jgi:hypothetical protein
MALREAFVLGILTFKLPLGLNQKRFPPLLLGISVLFAEREKIFRLGAEPPAATCRLAG